MIPGIGFIGIGGLEAVGGERCPYLLRDRSTWNHEYRRFATVGWFHHRMPHSPYRSFRSHWLNRSFHRPRQSRSCRRRVDNRCRAPSLTSYEWPQIFRFGCRQLPTLHQYPFSQLQRRRIHCWWQNIRRRGCTPPTETMKEVINLCSSDAFPMTTFAVLANSSFIEGTIGRNGLEDIPYPATYV